MDVPISVGIVLACAMSLFETMRGGEHAYFDSAVMLLFFLLVGRYLDRRARGRARLGGRAPPGAERRRRHGDRCGRPRTRPAADAVAAGHAVLAAAGERIGVDGRID